MQKALEQFKRSDFFSGLFVIAVFPKKRETPTGARDPNLKHAISISHLNSLNLQPKLIYNEQYQITKQFSFETGHALYGYDGKCKCAWTAINCQ
jgi:hypothetical protein